MQHGVKIHLFSRTRIHSRPISWHSTNFWESSASCPLPSEPVNRKCNNSWPLSILSNHRWTGMTNLLRCHGAQGGCDDADRGWRDVHDDVSHHDVHVVTLAIGGAAVQVDINGIQYLEEPSTGQFTHKRKGKGCHLKEELTSTLDDSLFSGAKLQVANWRPLTAPCMVWSSGVINILKSIPISRIRALVSGFIGFSIIMISGCSILNFRLMLPTGGGVVWGGAWACVGVACVSGVVSVGCWGIPLTKKSPKAIKYSGHTQMNRPFSLTSTGRGCTKNIEPPFTG